MTAATNVPGLEQRRAEAAGVDLRYLAGGAGEPFVLLHGLGGGALNWIELLPSLVERGRVLVPDLPGHGGSGRVPAGATMAVYADVVAGLAERELDAPALVAGHSFGGLVALRLALRRPDLVRGLLLVAPAGIASSAPFARAAIYATGFVRPGRWVAPLRFRYATRLWYRRALFRPWFVSDARSLSPRAAQGFLAAMNESVDVRAAGRALVSDDPRHELEHVTCPVVIVWGARDPQLPVDDAFEYTRRLRARLRVVGDCGHLVIGEAPRACLAALDELAQL
jgi:pimeloyl-ACP methyl ester carboxylesterase